MLPLGSLSAALFGGSKWVQGHFPKVVVGAAAVMVPANVTSRICLPVQSAYVGAYDDVQIDERLGISEYLFPQTLNGDVGQLSFLLGPGAAAS